MWANQGAMIFGSIPDRMNKRYCVFRSSVWGTSQIKRYFEIKTRIYSEQERCAGLTLNYNLKEQSQHDQSKKDWGSVCTLNGVQEILSGLVYFLSQGCFYPWGLYENAHNACGFTVDTDIVLNAYRVKSDQLQTWIMYSCSNVFYLTHTYKGMRVGNNNNICNILLNNTLGCGVHVVLATYPCCLNLKHGVWGCVGVWVRVCVCLVCVHSWLVGHNVLVFFFLLYSAQMKEHGNASVPFFFSSLCTCWSFTWPTCCGLRWSREVQRARKAWRKEAETNEPVLCRIRGEWRSLNV